MSDLKPTPARLRAMRQACSGDGWQPNGLYRVLYAAGLVKWHRSIHLLTSTPAGREWLARHDKPADDAGKMEGT